MRVNKKNKFKSYTELKVFNYDCKNGKIDEKSKALIESCTFDKNGNVITHSSVSGTAYLNNIHENKSQNEVPLDRKVTYKYNLNGIKIEEIEEDVSKITHISKYNNQGKLISHEIYENGKLTARSTQKYNNKENKVFGESYRDNILIEKSLGEYNNKGELISKEHYDKDGKLIKKFTRKYNDKGNKIFIEQRYNGSKLNIHSFSEYDYKGNAIFGEIYDKDGNPCYNTTFKYQYNDRGEWISREQYNSYDDFPWISTCEYNDKGNQISYKEYNLDGVLFHECFWEYNDKGNIIFREELSNELTSKTVYTYNEKDILIKETHYDNDGELLWLTVYEYK